MAMDCFNSPGGTDAYQPQTNAVQSGGQETQGIKRVGDTPSCKNQSYLN